MGALISLLGLSEEGCVDRLRQLVDAQKFDELIGALQALKAARVLERDGLITPFHAALPNLRHLEKGTFENLVATKRLTTSDVYQLLRVIAWENHQYLQDSGRDIAEVARIGRDDFWETFKARYPAFAAYAPSINNLGKWLEDEGIHHYRAGSGWCRARGDL
ncbi:MAG TPA: hypothetical protein VGE67_11675 [Haloferula sp.]